MWFNASTTCLPEDKWNQEKGCKIALLKAKRKAIEKENKFIDSKIDCAKVLMENLKKMMRQDYNKMIKNAKYKNLLNEELNKYIK